MQPGLRIFGFVVLSGSFEPNCLNSNPDLSLFSSGFEEVIYPLGTLVSSSEKADARSLNRVVKRL